MNSTRPFDLWGWNYTLNDIEALAKTLCSGTYQRHLLRVFNEGGGKAFGLAICDILKAHCPGASVPPWYTVSKTNKRRSCFSRLADFFSKKTVLRESLKLQLRSSTDDEDWLCRESGTNASVNILPKNLPHELSNPRWANQPVVVQRHVWGVGLVIDIGYSQLNGSVVGRVIAGRHKKEIGQCTSATWDGDGNACVWDANSGELISWVSGYYTGEFDDRYNYGNLIQRLYQAAQKIGINFGFQVELIIHPTEPDTLHLVQIRPTPRLVRGSVPFKIEPCSTINPLAKTPKVGTPNLLSYYEVVRIGHGGCGKTARGQYELITPWTNLPTNYSAAKRPPNKPFANKLVVWNDRGNCYFPGSEAWAMCALGAGVIISPNIRPNTAHDVPVNFAKPLLPYWAETTQQVSLFALEPAVVNNLFWITEANKKATIGVVSDGLLGYVYLRE